MAWRAREIGAAVTAAPRFLVGALMIVVTLLVNVEIAFRFFINLPLDAVSEIVLTLFPWLSLLGAAVAITVPGANVALHLLNARMSPRARILVGILINVTTAAFGLFLIVQGLSYTAMTGSEISNELEIPRSWQTSAFPVTGVLFIVYSAIGLFRLWCPSTQNEPSIHSGAP
jgi:TRAP-type C4-dicarboxylate transport system permease small subunit